MGERGRVGDTFATDFAKASSVEESYGVRRRAGKGEDARMSDER